MFKGNITVTADATGGSGAIIQAIFFDDASVTYSPVISTTVVSSSQNPAVAGGIVTWSAAVSGSGGTPTGTVDFFDGGTSLGTATLDSSGVATVSTAALAAGSHAITAVYSGDSTFAGSTSSVFAQCITPQTTPQLNIVSSSDSVILMWPTNADDYTLQSTTNLVSPAVWSAVSSEPIVINGQEVVTNAISGAQMFYRLSQ
jgi:hypothetical protein